jgi:antitoxin MazE
MPKAQLAKWGNSLAIRLPKTVVEQVRMQEGDAIEIQVVKGRVELRPAERVPTLKELVAQITRENRYEEMATGPERGKESVEW